MCPEFTDKHGKIVKHGLCVYRGSCYIGPEAKRVDVYDELLQTHKVNILLDSGMIHADQEVADQVWHYVLEGSFADMSLHEYLDRIFALDD